MKVIRRNLKYAERSKDRWLFMYMRSLPRTWKDSNMAIARRNQLYEIFN